MFFLPLYSGTDPSKKWHLRSRWNFKSVFESVREQLEKNLEQKWIIHRDTSKNEVFSGCIFWKFFLGITIFTSLAKIKKKQCKIWHLSLSKSVAGSMNRISAWTLFHVIFAKHPFRDLQSFWISHRLGMTCYQKSFR